MRLALPLFGKLFALLAINALLIGLLYWLMPGRGSLGWDALLTTAVRERLVSIGAAIGRELGAVEQAEWNEILEANGQIHGVALTFTRAFGPGAPPPPRERPAKPPPHAPNEHDPHRPDHERYPGKPPPPPHEHGAYPKGPPPPGGKRERPPHHAERERALAEVHITDTPLFGPYRVEIPISVPRAGAPPRNLRLHATTANLVPFLRFLGITEWLAFPATALLISVLLWAPFLWRLTRNIRQMTAVTERIAVGRFDARATTGRRDELGRLGESVNRMAERLGDYLSAQKRFVADVAHEVTSPLARIRMGLGLLAPRVPPEASGALADIEEDVEQMSQMLDELLLLSRADLQADRAPLVPADLAALVDEALHAESAIERITVNIAAGLTVKAQPTLLKRALANLIRNAMRYAADAEGPIEIVAERTGEEVSVVVRDRGPGVPASALPHLGEPFYRIEASRTRDRGGFGLGLAIVKRCTEACGGRCVFRNRVGGGFEAELRLQHAASPNLPAC